MREIKFRAWIDNELLSHEQLIDMDQETHAMYTIITNEENDDGITIMQFTGLKDKNGKEIFEGDIIRFTNAINEVYEEVGTVVFDLEECGYKAQYTDDGVTHCIYLINPKVFADRYTEITYEIIGNIYENPELLGGVGE